jgi:hypothetical protein
MKNSIMISNGGNFQHTPDNAQVVSSKEMKDFLNITEI